jgi:transcriptional regulator
VNDLTHLRPVERRILAMQAEGQSVEDIAARLRKSPRHVERMIEWTDVPRTGRPSRFARALEARILAMREEGHDHDEIGRRFRRSAANIRQIEALAFYRRALALLRGNG